MKKPLILIIEDDNEIRFTLEDRLREENFPVLSAGNGKQGLQILENFPILPDVIVMDLYMPIMNGFEFRETQLSHDLYKSIPVIMISHEYSDAPQMSKQKEVFLRKPFEFNHLLETIRSLSNS
jgi:DNA-binding response OmpR family regulator